MIKSRIKWTVRVARTEEGRNGFKILAGKPKRKRLLEKPRRRWEDNITIYFKEKDTISRNRVYSAQGRDCWGALVIAALKLRIR